MTIDEMIKRIKEKMACDYNISGCDTCNISSCEDKDIVIQLAEWLEELKELRNMTAGHLYAVAFNRGYLKAEKEVRENAIDDFAKWLENKKYLMKEIQEHNFCYTHYDELKANYVVTEYFEEQLKAGGVYDD